MLNAGHRQMIRAALGINWQNNITNEEIYAKSGLLLQFSQTTRKRRPRLIVASSESIYHTSRVNAAKTLTSYSRFAVEFGEGFSQRSEHN